MLLDYCELKTKSTCLKVIVFIIITEDVRVQFILSSDESLCLKVINVEVFGTNF